MARELLVEGRAADVARMIEPLIEPFPAVPDPGPDVDPGQVVLRTLMARVRLLRFGDPRQALELLCPFDPPALRARLPAPLRAEVALWLGWAYTWQDVRSYDGARALGLFDEAERLFQEEMNRAGRCWTLLGQALAYFTIDEYPLMRGALDAAAVLQEDIRDAQAERWLHELSVTAARLHGHYAQAPLHLDALFAFGRNRHDPHALGRAHAHQAIIHYEQGYDPDAVLSEAVQATNLLVSSLERPDYALLLAYHAQLGALLRRGAWPALERLAPAAAAATAHLSAAPACVELPLAQLDLIRGRYDDALARIDDVLSRLHRQHRLLTAGASALRAEVLLRTGAADEARTWATRAVRLAREAGHAGYVLRARLVLADVEVASGDAPAARKALDEAERHTAFLSLMPFAAPRFHLLARLARLEGHPAEARASLAQALSAYSLPGDVFRVAQVQLDLAKLLRSTAPLEAQSHLQAALHTLGSLLPTPELDEARALAGVWPSDAAPVDSLDGRSIGAALAQAALSVELVAETWLQVAGRLLPGRWLAVYRHRDAGPPYVLREHGAAPAGVSCPSADHDIVRYDGIVWLRLRRAPGPVFLFATTVLDDDPAWEAAFARLHPWLPVVTLALDHALLRARRLETDAGPDVAEADDLLPLKSFIHASPAMRDVARQLRRIRTSNSPVLIIGERGSGRTSVARALHALGNTGSTPLVTFHCAGVPPELLDSHLFGHEEGAFNGTHQPYRGVLRGADGGILLLEEVGELPLEIQSKLLRVLQDGEVFPLGARRPVPVQIRVLASTSADLQRLVREGGFREDLYYRLNVVPVRVPPLRERREEIPLLVRHFIDGLRPAGAPIASITNRALDALMHYDWPGNVRQLRNEIERALVLVGSEPAPLIDLKDLSAPITRGVDAAPELPAPPVAFDRILELHHDLDDVLAGTEKALIERVLAEHDGQVTATADVLGLTRQGLYKKMKRLGIDAARFKFSATSAS